MILTISRAALLAASLLAPAASYGATTQALGVSAGVVAGCEVAGDPGSTLPQAALSFGRHRQLSTAAPTAATPSSGNGAVTVRCNSASAAVLITFGPGQNASGQQRRMAAGSIYVDYDLFQDSAFAQPIGSIPLPLGAFTANEAKSLVVYGRVPRPLQASAAGSYTDLVSLTVTF